MTYRKCSPVYKRKKSHGRKTTLHRAIVEQHLGYPLPKYLHVHHINGDKSDNRIENLQVIRDKDHGLIHAPPKHPTEKRCEWCGTTYRPHKTKRLRSKTCGKTCAFALSGRNRSRISTTEVWKMHDQGMTQTAIAAALGVSQAAVWYHLNKPSHLTETPQ